MKKVAGLACRPTLFLMVTSREIILLSPKISLINVDNNATVKEETKKVAPKKEEPIKEEKVVEEKDNNKGKISIADKIRNLIQRKRSSSDEKIQYIKDLILK